MALIKISELDSVASILGTDEIIVNSGGVTYRTTARVLLEAAASDGLMSLDGLEASANQMIYSTDTDTFALAALTPFARTILDDTTQDAVRDTIGVKPPTRTFLTTGLAATYTPPAGCRKLYIVVQGPGGDGGAVASTTGTQSSNSGGGGAGGRAIKIVTGADVVPATYTIGSPGSDTTFNIASFTLVGGFGSAGQDSIAVVQGEGQGFSGGSGGIASGGDQNIQGDNGHPSAATGTSTRGFAGVGASSPYGAGGRGRGNSGASARVDGDPGAGYGSGGGGIAQGSSNGSRTGRAGAPGCIEIWEFY